MDQFNIYSWLDIFKFLDQKSKIHLTATCKFLNQLRYYIDEIKCNSHTTIDDLLSFSRLVSLDCSDCSKITNVENLVN